MSEQDALILQASAKKRITAVRICGAVMLLILLAAFLLKLHVTQVAIVLIVVGVAVVVLWGYPGMRDLHKARRMLDALSPADEVAGHES